MSRSTFAQRFKETVGELPMEYLVRLDARNAACVANRAQLSDAKVCKET